MNSITKKVKRYKKKHEKKQKKEKRKRHSSSSSSSSSSTNSSTSSSSDESSKKKHKKSKKYKHCKKDHKKAKLKDINKTGEPCTSNQQDLAPPDQDFSIPLYLMDNQAKKRPETQEEYLLRQSVLRREVDPETGRIRLIKGDGEIIEEIVSRDRHHEINKQATQTDAQVFANKSIGWAVTNNKK
ncbi:unnamed protein product [Diamesa serratosioi]